MPSPRALSGSGQAELVASADCELLVCAPYIAEFGVRSITAHLSDRLRSEGRIVVVTDLSPVSVATPATDPLAIVTSGNLTFGGWSAIPSTGCG